MKCLKCESRNCDHRIDRVERSLSGLIQGDIDTVIDLELNR